MSLFTRLSRFSFSSSLKKQAFFFSTRSFVQTTEAKEYIENINPYNGRPLDKIELSDINEANELLSLCSIAQDKYWSGVCNDSSLRIDKCREFVNNLKSLKDSFAGDLTFYMGKPFHQSRYEVDGMIERAEGLIDMYETYETEYKIPAGTDKLGLERKIKRLPLGVVFIISPWNYPLLCSINSIIPALLTGNSILLKTSSKVPNISNIFARALKSSNNKYLYPDNLITPLNCKHSVVESLLSDKNNNIQFTVFTGSVEGGYAIQKAAQNKLYMNTTLELGGKDPAYVAEDANVEFSAYSVVDGATYNAGQSCCAIERVYVHEHIYDRFIEECKNNVGKLKIGNPWDDDTTLGPLASKSQLDVLEDQIQDALSKGGKLLCGSGKRKKDNTLQGQFFDPTIVIDCNHSMKIMKEESFGPVLPIMKVSDELETIKLMNDSEYGLTASVYTKDKEKAYLFGDMLNTGTVFMNRCDYLDPMLPWCGVKDTGKGVSLSKHCFNSFTRLKGFNFQTIIHDETVNV